MRRTRVHSNMRKKGSVSYHDPWIIIIKRLKNSTVTVGRSIFK